MKLTIRERCRICELYQDGKKMGLLASQFGVSSGCVWCILVKAEIPLRKKESNRKLQDISDQNRVIDLYGNGMGCNEIAKIFGVSKEPILRIVKNVRKLRSPSQRCQKYRRDSLYFREIDHERKAYWLGLIAADGNIHKDFFSLPLKASDRKLLEMFLVDLKSDAPIHLVQSERNWKLLYPTGRTTTTTMARIGIGDKILIADLRKLGIVERKTYILKIPPLKNQFLRHFIRGFFDGDGSITSDKSSIVSQGLFSLPSASGKFIAKIQKILIKECNLSNNKIIEERQLHTLRYGGNRQCLRIYHYLYDDATRFLPRKKEKFEEILREKLKPNQISLGTLL